jgi:hypothetical protein
LGRPEWGKAKGRSRVGRVSVPMREAGGDEHHSVGVMITEVCPPTGDGHGLITDEPAQDEGRAGRNEKDAARPVARRAGRGSWEGEPPRPRL